MKLKFNFPPIATLVDVFVNGYKVRDKHNGKLGQVCVHAEPTDEVEIRPNDPRIPIQAEFNAQGQYVIIEQEPVKELPPIRAVLEGTKPESATKKDFV